MRPEYMIDFLFRAIKYLPCRLGLIERWLELDLDESDYTSIQEACTRSNEKIGTYYYWYLQKKIVAGYVRDSNRERMLKIVRKMDQTDYKKLDLLPSGNQGAVIAIPHYGHYIASIISAMEKIRESRDIYMFYGDPKTHGGNEIFDKLASQLFSPSSGAHILHTDRKGMADALKALKNGNVVFIMPDVFMRREDTLTVPFFDRQLNVMLGAATLARKTNSIIIPAISMPNSGLHFSTVFGAPIETSEIISKIPEKMLADYSIDYATIIRIFYFYEKSMRDKIIYWQYIRQHFRKKKNFPFLSPDMFTDTWDNFIADPRTTVDLSKIIALD